MLRRIIGRLREDIRIYWLPVLIILVIFLTFRIIWGTVCPFKALLGIRCPGCGLTHSCIYLLTGRFQMAAVANPAGYLWLPYLFMLLFHRYILGRKMRWNLQLLILICLVTLFIWVFSFKPWKPVKVLSGREWHFMQNGGAIWLLFLHNSLTESRTEGTWKNSMEEFRRRIPRNHVFHVFFVLCKDIVISHLNTIIVKIHYWYRSRNLSCTFFVRKPWIKEVLICL